MSWLFSQALAEEYSADTSLAGQQFAQLNVMPTQQQFWRNDKMMDASQLSQFGLTCAVLTEGHGAAVLMSYLEAFPAKTLAVPEKAPELKEAGQDFGQKWCELLVKYDLDSCSWKTHHCLFPEDLHWSSVTLPAWGMTRTGHVFQHQMLERPIKGIVSGLWPTPTANCGNGPGTQGRKGGLNLQTAVAQKWPTPKASDYNKRGAIDVENPRNGLAGAVLKFPTPQASDCRDRGDMSDPVIQRRIANCKQVNLSMVVKDGPAPGTLNPDWVEWLMGWPIGWTDLKPLEMAKFQQWQLQHSRF